LALGLGSWLALRRGQRAGLEEGALISSLALAVAGGFVGAFGLSVGVRFGGQVQLGGGYFAFGNLSYEHREYNGPDPVFLVVREDDQTDATLGLSYLWRPGATLRAQIVYTSNSSNIVLNDYDRTEISLAARFNF